MNGICISCGGRVSENSRTQRCQSCRTMKCKHYGCDKMVVARTQSNGYCQKHTAGYRKFRDEGLFQEV